MGLQHVLVHGLPTSANLAKDLEKVRQLGYRYPIVIPSGPKGNLGPWTLRTLLLMVSNYVGPIGPGNQHNSRNDVANGRYMKLFMGSEFCLSLIIH